MRKIFAIFVAITLWNASALGADQFDDSLILDPQERLCAKDAPYSTREACEKYKGPNQVCCAKIVIGNPTITYTCDTGYTKTLSRCKKTTETSDETGYKNTVEICDADTATTPGVNTTCYYLQESANGLKTCVQEMVQ